MEIAALLFSLLVGFFHFAGEPATGPNTDQEMIASEPAAPVSYGDDYALKSKPESGSGGQLAMRGDEIASAAGTEAKQMKQMEQIEAPQQVLKSTNGEASADLAESQTNAELIQRVADASAVSPQTAARTVSQALKLLDRKGTTLGDVATLAAAATKAAPEHAPAIAGALARSLDQGREPALAAAVATVVSLVPEQAREIGLVVGAIIGDQPETLAMVAQTIAIAAGQETFTSLAESSGVEIATLMKEGTRIGVRVPFEVPSFAADQAPEASMFADGAEPGIQRSGDL